MITNITLENFKCFRQVSINPKLLTVLIGPNGTGKSSILQALLKYKHVIQSMDSDVGVSQPSLVSDEIKTTPIFSDDRSMNSISIRTDGFLRESDPERATLNRLRFVPAARGFTRASYALRDSTEQQIPSQGGLGIQEEQLATNLVYMPEDEEWLSNVLKRVAGTGLRADMVPQSLVEIKSLTKSGSINLLEEGFGANALIQLLHQLIIADRGATVLIEEPEIHLHPKAQAELAEVLAETAKAEDKQIIMTTHSEHLVERLLLLVAEGTLTADDLAIYSFRKDEIGECFADEIVVTENGQVEGGLTDFYANNLETLDRRVKALKRSQ